MNNETVQMIITLLGGLALFIFGMNFMSDGLQRSAGDKMRSILAMLTRNPVLGAVAGALVTAVLQSSSATTVMVIGFVSAGLMKLPQAPWYAWLGGVLAPVITLTVMWAIGSLTPTVAISAILLSQLTVAALIDVFGWLGAEKMPFSWEKWVGVALMVGGVILMKIKT